MERLKGPSEYVTDPYDQQSMYEDIAKSSESLEPKDIAAIAGVESQFGKYTKPLAGGSARGEFQIMPNTLKYLSERADSKGIPREANPLREQARVMAELIPQHEEELKKTLGPDADISASDIYVKHALGQGMGKKLLKASPDTLAEEILPEKVIAGNPSIYEGKSKSEIMKEIQKRLNKKSTEFKFEKRGPLDFLED
jgi:hypothetical protein